MNANKAVELGFADGILTDEKRTAAADAFTFSGKTTMVNLVNKIMEKTEQPKAPVNSGTTIESLEKRLNLLSH